MKSSAFALISLCLETVKSITSLASAITLTIPAKANILNLKQGTSPNPGGTNNGIMPPVYKFSAGTLGAACAVSLLSFATPAQAAFLKITTPDIKVVNYINDFDIFECAINLVDTVSTAGSLLCPLLNATKNPQPSASFTEESWEKFIDDKEYRGYIHVPSFSVFSDGENIISYTRPANKENKLFSYGYTPSAIPGVDRTYSDAEVYNQTPYNGREFSPTGNVSLNVTDRRASRVSTLERLGQYFSSGYDAPFVYAELEELIPANGSSIGITVNRSEFPTTRLYINNNLMDEEAQVADLSDFFVSGGRIPNLDGQGNFAPIGSDINVLYSPEITLIDEIIGSGTTNGIFDTIRPGIFTDEPTFINGEGTNKLEFGFPPNLINSFAFNGTSFETIPGKNFVLGTFTYDNGIVISSGDNTTYTSNLTISTNSPFYSPINFNQSLSELISLVTTPNIGTPEENADIIFFPNLPNLGRFRVLEGQSATVELLGEFGSLNLIGFGRVLSGSDTGFVEPISVPVSVPESSSPLGIIGFSVLGGGFLLKRKLNNLISCTSPYILRLSKDRSDKATLFLLAFIAKSRT